MLPQFTRVPKSAGHPEATWGPGRPPAMHDDPMLSLLLSAVLAWPVTFPGGPTITLSLPDDDPDDPYTYFRPETVFNPQHSYAAVRRCGTAGANLDRCMVFLVDPSRGSRPLPQGEMGGFPALKWTPDGRYLIAAGEHSLRLWNLRGAVRGITPGVAVDPPEQLLSRWVKGVEVRGHWLCVRTEVELDVPLYATPGLPDAHVDSGPLHVRHVDVRQAYRWPTLQKGTPADDRRCQGM